MHVSLSLSLPLSLSPCDFKESGFHGNAVQAFHDYDVCVALCHCRASFSTRSNPCTTFFYLFIYFFTDLIRVLVLSVFMGLLPVILIRIGMAMAKADAVIS